VNFVQPTGNSIVRVSVHVTDHDRTNALRLFFSRDPRELLRRRDVPSGRRGERTC
jgi:hypothetical protein